MNSQETTAQASAHLSQGTSPAQAGSTSRGVTAPQGFKAAATTAGIKPSGKPDMALVINEGPLHTAAAVFTRNRVCASPVKWSRAAIANGVLQAVVLNAGNANACNGPAGDTDTQETARHVADALGIDPLDVAVCSTGIIGEPLPMEKVHAGIESLVPQLGDHGAQAAVAIMTTDTVPKETVVLADGWVLGGMGKGVGMISPSLATMLVVLTTDAVVSPEVAEQALHSSVSTTFNRLDIDGTTSTNDTVIIMASGVSGVKPTAEQFAQAVQAACADITRQMQSDAEGVTKRVTITVRGTATDAEAVEAARVVGRDNLCKTAMFGSDPNWGRILAAVGMAPAEMDPDNISVAFNGHLVCQQSTGTPDARQVDLTGSDILVEIDLGTQGSGEGTVYTTDLSHDYVEINSAYTT